MSRVARSIPTQSPQEIVRRIPGLIDRHRAAVRVSAAAQSVMARAITLQVIDRQGQAWKSRWRVRFYLTATEGGNPSATGNTVAFTTGTAIQTITANAHYEVLTDADGIAAFSLTLVGAGSRFVYAEAVGEPEGSEELVWV